MDIKKEIQKQTVLEFVLNYKISIPYYALIFKFLAVFYICLSLSGCVKLALRSVPSFIPNFSQTFFEECDTDLAKRSLPAALKIMEGLLKNDPENKQILIALCSGFTGYAMLFAEEENPEKASSLYRRARDYGLKALGLEAPNSNDSKQKESVFHKKIKTIGEENLATLFWTTMAWNAWINLNLDIPAALGQVVTARACLEKVIEIKPDYYHGTAYILRGSMLAAMPGFLGGNEKLSREYFEKGLQASNRKYFLAHYYYARYYAVRVQDKALFLKLIDEIEYSSPCELKDACLINAVMQEKSKRLREISEELFL